ncbi:transient receptor potential cation channel subfamily M member 8-like [Dreissena polymorpha]|uniref:transient receptor potential cation channel subfamily M member 8-like n=1 Tax=Dreissena polymorpha TaxID=45954 RepID=UPI0022656BBB|nr:transient receptor potential cation channel subfamily M member 8-like [Dreissena polymorpha]
MITAKHTVLWVMQRVKERPVRGTYNGSEDLRPATYAPGKQVNQIVFGPPSVLPYWDYMFLWALLLRKHDIAKILWTKTENPLFMALIAHNFFEAVKMQTNDKVLIAEMKKYLSEWSTVAIDCLYECYQKSEEATYSYLTMTMPFWNEKSCLDLAFESNNMEFLAQQACRNIVGDIWNGRMKDKLKEISRYGYSGTNKIKRFLDKMQSPKTKFANNMISYLVFLSLFAYVLLFELTNTVSTKEFVLVTWVLTILVEEITQMHQIYHMPSFEKASSCVQRIRKLKNYFSEGWNWIDMFTIVMFLLGFGLRFKQSRDTFDWPRVVLAVDFVAFVFRLMHIFSVEKTLGPKLIIIQRMVKDLLYFLVIMAVFVLAYAIASHSILYPGAPVTWETARQIIRKPYFHLYGELFLDETEDSTDCTNDASLWTNGTTPRCPSEAGKIVVPIMMGVYLLFSNILLLNLLIAMFSYTFTTIHEQSDKIWCFQRYFIIKDYALRPVLCPPLNVVWHIYQLFRCCLHKCKRSQESDDAFRKYHANKEVYFTKFVYVPDNNTSLFSTRTLAIANYSRNKRCIDASNYMDAYEKICTLP